MIDMIMIIMILKKGSSRGKRWYFYPLTATNILTHKQILEIIICITLQVSKLFYGHVHVHCLFLQVNFTTTYTLQDG